MQRLEAFYETMVATWGLFGVFAAALVMASIGSVTGMVSRNIASLAGLVVIVGAAVYFHESLPLPRDWHAEIGAVKFRIFGAQ